MQTLLVILIVLSIALGHYEAIVCRRGLCPRAVRTEQGSRRERVFLDKYRGRYSSSGCRTQYADPRLQIKTAS